MWFHPARNEHENPKRKRLGYFHKLPTSSFIKQLNYYCFVVIILTIIKGIVERYEGILGFNCYLLVNIFNLLKVNRKIIVKIFHFFFKLYLQLQRRLL